MKVVMECVKNEEVQHSKGKWVLAFREMSAYNSFASFVVGPETAAAFAQAGNVLVRVPQLHPQRLRIVRVRVERRRLAIQASAGFVRRIRPNSEHRVDSGVHGLQYFLARQLQDVAVQFGGELHLAR